MFDRIIAVDWSARASPSPLKPSKDAIFICDTGGRKHPEYYRTRAAAMAAVGQALDDALVRGQRVLVGFDFAFGYPAGFAAALTGRADPLGVWDWFSGRIEDAADNANNRFEVAAEVNDMFPGIGPFWGCPAGVSLPGLPAKGTLRQGHGMAERRAVEGVVRSAHSVWKLYTTGAVGSQTLLGVPHLARLRRQFGQHLRVWPFEERDAPITVAEIYPSMMRFNYLIPLAKRWPEEAYDILDAQQVRWVCDGFAAIAADLWARAMLVQPGAREEGWILGAGLARTGA